MAELIEFSRDISEAFGKLSGPMRLVLGSAIGIYLLKTFGKSIAIRLFRATKPLRQKKQQIKFEDGVVYLHMFPRNFTKKVPNLSPYAVKVETWLRLKNIKYQIVETLQFSKSTGQFPYIIYNGQEYSDSELIIDFLTKEFKLDKTDDLPPEKKGAERAIISMLDEKTALAYLLYRYNFEINAFKRFYQPVGTPYFIKRMIFRAFPGMIMTRCKAQGIGRKPRDTVVAIANADLKALSSYLGDEKFLMGDQITRADCCAFAHLCQIFYVDLPYPFKTFADAECSNLISYVDRVKSALWPDWNIIVDDTTFEV